MICEAVVGRWLFARDPDIDSQFWPTTNDQRPTTNDQRPIYNSRFGSEPYSQ